MTRQRKICAAVVTIFSVVTVALALPGALGEAATPGTQSTVARHRLELVERGASSAEYWGTADGGVFRVTRPRVVHVPGSITQVATSNGAWYVLTSNGTVWAWGAGQHGQLGDGRTTSTLKPVKVRFPAGVKIAFLADTSPYDTALAVDTAGRAWGWGYNSDGQLCDGQARLTTAPLRLAFSHVTALTGAGDHALYLSNGTLYACGGNGHGDLGIGTSAPSKVPVVVALSGVTAVTSSWRTSGALVGGTYYSWGYNGTGAVGDGSTTDVRSPRQIPLPAPVTTIRLGGGGPLNGQTLALLSNGSLWAWGADTYGQLGDDGNGLVTSPKEISTPAQYAAVESCGETSYGIDTTGNLWAWGSNRHDQLGDGATTTQLTPVVLAKGVREVSATAGAVLILH